MPEPTSFLWNLFRHFPSHHWHQLRQDPINIAYAFPSEERLPRSGPVSRPHQEGGRGQNEKRSWTPQQRELPLRHRWETAYWELERLDRRQCYYAIADSPHGGKKKHVSFSLDLVGFLLFCDTPSVFGCAVAPEALLLDSESCSYAIAGTAYWTETPGRRQCCCAIAGRSRGCGYWRLRNRGWEVALSGVYLLLDVDTSSYTITHAYAPILPRYCPSLDYEEL